MLSCVANKIFGEYGVFVNPAVRKLLPHLGDHFRRPGDENSIYIARNPLLQRALLRFSDALNYRNAAVFLLDPDETFPKRRPLEVARCGAGFGD